MKILQGYLENIAILVEPLVVTIRYNFRLFVKKKPDSPKFFILKSK